MLNLPNRLTILRIFLIPIIVFLIYLNTNTTNLIALICFIIAGLSDFFDGYLARKYSLTSDFGTMLDPIADKLLVILVGIVLCYRGDISGINLLPLLLIISREVFISGLREFLAQGNKKITIPVSNLGKYKTAFQMLALILLILNPIISTSLIFIEVSGILLLWIASILSVLSGYQYYRSVLTKISQDYDSLA